MKLINFIEKFKHFSQYFKKNKKDAFIPAYRVVRIMQEKDDNYIVTIQVINKNICFKAKPEELLAKDEIVDQFSPRDIRALTYLGYLGINAPKYKILANRLLAEDSKLVFAIQKRGDKKIITKTADEILKEDGMLENLSSKDAHLIGYAVGSERTTIEKKQKEEAVKRQKQEKIMKT